MSTSVKITRREADSDRLLPLVCIRCGEKATHRRRNQFQWCPLPFRFMGILGLLMSRWMTVNVPLCDKHKLHFWKPLIIFGIGLAAFAVLMVLSVIVMAVASAALGEAGAVLGVAMFGLTALGFFGLIGALIWTSVTLVRPMEINERGITLLGVSEKFARALESQRRGGRPSQDEEDEEDEEPVRAVPGRRGVAGERGFQSRPGVRPPVAVGRGRDEEDDDDEDEEEPRLRQPKEKTPVLLIVLLVVGLLGVMGVVVCGGLVWMIASMRPQHDPPVVVGPGGNPNLNPPPFVPPAGGGGMPFVPPVQQPKTLDDAVADLKSREPDRRRAGAEWLKNQPVNEARKNEVATLLAAATDDNDVGVRSVASEALFVWATRDSVPALIKLLTDKRPNHAWDVAKRSIDTLGRLKDERAAAVIAERLPNFFEHDHAKRALEAIGPGAQAEVLRYLNHPNDHGRNDARALLAAYRTPVAMMVEQSQRDLQDADINRRRHALDWLATAKVPDDQQAALAKSLEGLLSDREVRDPAAKALAPLATADNVPALIRALGSESGQVRQSVTEALVRLKDERAAEPLAKRLPDFFDRERARKALEDLGPLAEKAVLKYYHHADFGVRGIARKLAEGYGTKPDAILTQSVEDLSANEAQVRRGAAEWIGKAAVVKDRQGEVSTALAGMLRDRDDGVSQEAIKALKEWVTKGNAQLLVDWANDKGFNPHANFMRNTALEVLGQLKDDKLVDVIVPHLSNAFDKEAAKKGLIAMGASGEKAVAKQLTNPDAGVRREVCVVLEAIGTKDSLKALQSSATRDPDPGVRVFAAKAMQAINGRK